MKSIVDMMIEKDYQNDLLELYEKETGKEPVPPDGGHTPEFENWFVKKCEEAEKAGCKDADSALDFIYPSPEKAFDKEPQRYYILMEEWLYPTESGREYVCDYDNIEDAIRYARKACMAENYNFAHACGCDPSSPDETVNKDGNTIGVIITDKKGLEDWWYAIKIIPVEHGFEDALR